MVAGLLHQPGAHGVRVTALRQVQRRQAAEPGAGHARTRAAEAAVPQGKQLVIAAVKDMTISDALNILKGGDTAATDYLRAKTQDKLRVAFTPYMKDALASSGAFTAMESVAGQYGVGGVTSSLQSDLTGYAVNLGLDGMFYYVAQEEKKIRENPVARTTELLRRVFGTPV